MADASRLCTNKNETMRPGGVGIVVVVVAGGFVFHSVCQVAPRPEATAELKTKITTSSCSEPPASVSPQRGFRFPPIYERRHSWFWLSRLSKLFPSWQPLGKFTTQGIRLLPKPTYNTGVDKHWKLHLPIVKDCIVPVPSEMHFYQTLDKVGWIWWDPINGRTGGLH